MQMNPVIKRLLCLVFLFSIPFVHAQNQGALTCSSDEVPAVVITYEHFVTRLIDEQPDRKGRQVVIATADASYFEETGGMLTMQARQRGEITYTPYRKQRWETSDAEYTYLSVGNIARVRMHPVTEKNLTPYKLLSDKGPVRTIADYQCNWSEEDMAGVLTTQRCEAVFYGWTIPLYTRKIAQGRDILFSEATDISQRCVKKESVYVPEDKPWKFSE
ncbi:hypothetical protein [Amphritea atlantica]|nr:hypothetical protein [Amphritea atlantica]